MDCWDNYCYYPWPVAVTVNSPSGGSVWTWLAPLLLLSASLAASGVAWYGIRKSNATNRAAITAADNRATVDRAASREKDHQTWQRDTLLRLGTEAMDATYAIQDHYRAIAHESKSENVLPHLDLIQAEAKRIAASFASLRLIGAHEAADRCRAIRTALGDRQLQVSSLEAQRECRRASEAADEDKLKFETGAALWRLRLDAKLDSTLDVLTEFGDTIERELDAINSFNQNVVVVRQGPSAEPDSRSAETR